MFFSSAEDAQYRHLIKKNLFFLVVVDNSHFESLPMCGVEVRLPCGLRPYPSQKLMMVRMLTSIAKRLNLLAESPTGSGKTLALLASSCAWLDSYRKNRQEARLTCPVHGEGISVGQEAFEALALHRESGAFIHFSHFDRSKATCRGMLSVSSQLFQKVEVSPPAKVEPKNCICLPRTRIYYGTRTHKQIGQVVKEFSRLPYSGVISHTILASREQSCINLAARESRDVSGYCKELISAGGVGTSVVSLHPYLSSYSVLVRDAVTFDIEELVDCLSSMPNPICPYFSSTRLLTQDADLIFCPFSYLVDPIIRNSSDVHLKNSVVILDEAHNIEDNCREAASFTFFEKEISDALTNIKEKGGCFLNRKYSLCVIFHLPFSEALTLKLIEKYTRPPDNKLSSAAVICIEKWMYFIGFFKDETKRSMYKMNVSSEKIQQYNTDHPSFTHGEARRDGQAGPKNVNYSQLTGDQADVWLSSTQGPGGHDPIRSGCRTSISLWCMSPELAFTSAFADCRSVILASGTLCPVDTLKTELGLKFHSQMEGDQVIPADQIFASVLPVYKSCYNFSTICMTVPKGILCFLPSYRMLSLLYDYMESTSLLRQLQTRKVVVKEPRRSSDLPVVMEVFEDAVRNPSVHGRHVDGALMFAVFRGKVSEGIDFADDLARLVISVGIPFPNAMDDLVKEKKVYNDQFCKTKSLLSGDQWYVSQAYRALNQALGRCLRHRNDWGALVLIDERLVEQASKSLSSARVSKWIQKQLVVYPRFEIFEASLSDFVRRMQLKDEERKCDQNSF
ncbi:unnamed protein product [Heligmosomoides polygyrus]|uniref:DNA helicase n=1 Tax=Heligmosomoides polygyrus TaxID=6339 RepID=A0A3P7Z0Z3_HELPZ|nr:unnamed protein product [Heligmosomoides polygyrus]